MSFCASSLENTSIFMACPENCYTLQDKANVKNSQLMLIFSILFHLNPSLRPSGHKILTFKTNLTI